MGIRLPLLGTNLRDQGMGHVLGAISMRRAIAGCSTVCGAGESRVYFTKEKKVELSSSSLARLSSVQGKDLKSRSK